MPPCLAVTGDPEGSFTLATAKGGGLDKESATTFALPAMCLTSEVSSARNESCHCTLAIHGSKTLCMACVRGLYSEWM